MTGDLGIRPARAEDRPAVEHICAHTWEWGDYLPDVWDQWLADPRGVLQVGEIDGRVVAVNKIAFHEPEQAWLEGMRVDPEYRRRGIAREFMVHDFDYVRQHGARVVRLATGHSNTAVHTLVAEFGMQRVSEGSLYEAAARPGEPVPVILGPEHTGHVLAAVRESPVLAHTHGLYDCGWAGRFLSDNVAALMLAAGPEVRRWAAGGERPARLPGDNPAAEHLAGLLGPAGELRALATVLTWAGDEEVWIGFADAAPGEADRAAAVGELAAALRGHAARLRAGKAQAMLPAVDWLVGAFRSAGYEQGDWQGELWVFEKWLYDPS
jgi:GNAT superfamily N-acetyltransferase